ncbi:MAG: 50S ribosomal protein L25 [bacterium]
MDIVAKKRELKGKKVRLLRREKILPAVVFGQAKESLALEISLIAAEKILKTEGESTLLDLVIEGEKEPRKVLISEVQRNFVTDTISHISFHEVSLKEKITAHIPIEFVGESPVVKSGKGILITLIDEIEVECLPTDLPNKFEVDISNLLEIDDFITVETLSYDKDKITIDIDKEALLIKVDYAEQLEEETVTSVEDVEVSSEKPVEEGEEDKEGKESKEDREEKKGKEGKESKGKEEKEVGGEKGKEFKGKGKE